MFNPQNWVASYKLILGRLHKLSLELCILDSNILEAQMKNFSPLHFMTKVDQEKKTHHTFQDVVRR